MRRRTALATLFGVFAGGIAGYSYKPAREDAVDRYREASPALLAGDFQGSAVELQLSPQGFQETGWEHLNREDPERDPNEVEQIDDPPTPGDTSTALFYNHTTGSIVLSVVAVTDGSTTANDAYNDLYSEHAEQYSLEALDIGTESHAYRTGASVVVFRERNVLGIVGYEPNGVVPEVDDALAIAETLIASW